MIKIYSYQNSLKVNEGGNKYCFRSVADQILDSEQLIRELVNYNSTLTEADARAVLAVLDDRVRHFVNLGYKVELPFGYVFNKAKGTVGKLTEGFVPGTSNHRILPAFKFKDDAAADMTRGAAYKLAGSGYITYPVIKEICSVQNDGNENEVLEFSANSMLQLKGKDLSFDIADDEQGLFLVAPDKSRTRLASYNRIGTRVVEAYIPSGLSAGSYEVEVVTKPGTDRYEKHVFNQAITVKE